MQLLDKNNDGHIDIDEFLVAVRVSNTCERGCQAETATAKFETKAN